MLTLRVELEDWREKLIFIENKSIYTEDQLAMLLREEVLSRLDLFDVDYQRARQQSKGAFVILQHSDSQDELDKFELCMKEAVEIIENLALEKGKVHV
jgi:hypothetical protein